MLPLGLPFLIIHSTRHSMTSFDSHKKSISYIHFLLHIVHVYASKLLHVGWANFTFKNQNSQRGSNPWLRFRRKSLDSDPELDPVLKIQNDKNPV